ncbi:uncharacterized protein LOC129724828 [Wyeomyia smithii]|uniref:uncharacterized protein LOC129724828 n=1 Tax=Wyeomyia smithii TaxID=174621 RepID=UPI002467B556|nr:uncharacterized protein LOC129724828 [Wyeomyia smithii]
MHRTVFLLAVLVGLANLCRSQDSEVIQESAKVLPASVDAKLNSPQPDLKPDEFLHRGKQYFIHCLDNERVEFFAAWQFCNSIGQELGAVVSEHDDELLAKKAVDVYNKELWLSGTNLGRHDSWVWLVNGREVGWGNNFLKWARGQPHGSDKCMLVTVDKNGGEWRSASCHEKRCFVCQKYLT